MNVSRGMRIPQAIALLACVTGDPIVADAAIVPVPARHDRPLAVVTGTLFGGVPFTVGSANDWRRRFEARGVPMVAIARARYIHLHAVAARLHDDLALSPATWADTLDGLTLTYTLIEYAARGVARAYSERARAVHLGIGGPQ